jgi:hypothetical protein
MAFTPEETTAPKDRPAGLLRRHWRVGLVLAAVISLAVHFAILWFLFPDPRQWGYSGGTGWADEIEIRSSRESSSGLEGEEGATGDETAQVLQQFDVSIVFAPPPPRPEPEPEEYLPDEEPEEVADEQEIDEPDIVEEEVTLVEPTETPEERPTETRDPEGLQAVRETEAEVPTDVPGDGAGEGGLNTELAGSPLSGSDNGRGSGNADTGREGNFVPGGQLRDLLEGWTLIGTNGFADGSVNSAGDNRGEIPWNIYYAPNGRIEARFRRYGARQAHGRRGFYWFQETGRWTVEGDQLCQRITRWGGGGVTCFEVHRDGDNVAMYYSYCRGVHRCWEGRLGPRGIIRSGRHLRDSYDDEG